jgi:hypothetical protein
MHVVKAYEALEESGWAELYLMEYKSISAGCGKI